MQFFLLLLRNWKIAATIVNFSVIYYLHTNNEHLVKESLELKDKVITLENEIKSISYNRDEISKISKKQAQIAHSTNVNAESVHKWMLKLSSKYK